MPKKSGPGDIADQDAQPTYSQTIGAYLRDKRRSLNMGLEEVSETTGISKAVLRALENEDREQLPAEVYIKAFYKKYAAFLGIGSEEVDAKYQQQSRNKKKEKRSSNFSTVITLKGQEDNLLSQILRRLFLPISIFLLGLLLYLLYKNYLTPTIELGLYPAHLPSVCFFFVSGSSCLFC